jgi:hypothetical protein
MKFVILYYFILWNNVLLIKEQNHFKYFNVKYNNFMIWKINLKKLWINFFEDF